ncbi:MULTISPECIES: MFS transporter [Sphingobium]|uniref:MFS transporter n=1 Tax=Sphingobium TaxID=165695 RepID=UPI00159C16C3|nr:MFS transporter [Sphingobium sp. 15-1]
MNALAGSPAIAVETLVDEQRVGAPLFRLIGICGLLMACDAYDLSALAYVAPSLMKLWGIAPITMGFVIAAAMLGMLAGSLILGEAGDRFGRRRIIICAAFCFAAFTILAGFTSSPLQLALVRFGAALGLGGVTPNVIALASEMIPSRLRATSIGIIFSGFLLGGIAAGLVAAEIVPEYGWQAIFWIGGSLSLLCAVAVSLLLPESLTFLVGKPAPRSAVLKAASALRPDVKLPDDATLVLGHRKAEKLGVKALFAHPQRGATIWVWALYFACALSVFFIGNWLPTMVVRQGFDGGVAAYATAAMFAGGAVGSVIGGVVTDRFGFLAITILAILAAAAITALGLAHAPHDLVIISLFTGGAMLGSQSSLHGIVGSVYPAEIRAAGVGWASGISKTGAIAAPVIGGSLMPHLAPIEIYAVAGLPMLVVAIAALLLRALLRGPMMNVGQETLPSYPAPTLSASKD